MSLEINIEDRTFEVLDEKRTIAYGEMTNEDDFSDLIEDIYKYAYNKGKKDGIDEYKYDEEIYNINRSQSLGID